MLNFRYHVVSLVAVFLALGLGILVGYGALDRPTVEFLQNRIRSVEANAEQRRRENETLQGDLDRLNAAAGVLAPFAVTDRLTDTSVLIIAVRGVDEETVGRTVELARRAGATAPGILWLEERWVLRADEDVDALVLASGVGVGRRREVRNAALAALTTRLTSADAGVNEDSPLRALADNGFLSYQPVGDASSAIEQLGGPGAQLVLVVGTGDALRPRQSILPIARAAVDGGAPIVVGELFAERDDGPDRGSLVAAVRDDDALAARVSTVDDLDQPSGPVVTVLALADLARDVVGHFGLGEDAAALAPEWWQP